MNHTHRIAFLLVMLACTVCSNCVLAAETPGEIQFRQWLIRTLTNAGIDVESNDKLLEAAKQIEKAPTAVPAMQLLVIRGEKRVIPILKENLKTYQDNLSLYHFNILATCEALQTLGDTSEPWKTACVKMLSSPIAAQQCEAATLLAKQGDGQGWLIVRNALLETKDTTLLWLLVEEVPFFDGLTYEEKGSRKFITLTDFCAETSQLQFLRLQMLIYVLEKVAKKKDVKTLEAMKSDVEINAMLDAIIDRLNGKTPPAPVQMRTETQEIKQ